MAVNFAGLQCQIQLGDFQENKHKPGFIEKLEEYLPAQYSNAWNVEKKILKEYSTNQGQTELEAKFLYIKTARALPTYGVTFFLVKEKQKDKKKLVPRLLGINAEAILRLDEVTKEILQQWPLTHVKTYHAGKSQTFTLNFGDYSDKEYSVKTQDCHRIRDILEGYIDIIRRRMLARPCADPGESMAICHDNVQMGKSHLIQHGSYSSSKMVTESFVGPTKLVPYDQGSHAQSGAMITTVQQIVVTDHLKNQQQALKSEMPLRGDMSQDCIRKLNRMNSNSVKIVGLLTDPTETHVKDAQQIVRTMQEDFPVVDKGVKETADKQAIDDAKKMLLDELQDLNNYMNKLAGAIETENVNPSEAKDAAECIADLTTQMYFSIDPKTKRRSELLRRSRKSFRDGEKTEQTIRRASFVAAATTALHAVDTAAHALHEEYTGPKLNEVQQKKLEQALEDRMGKLNAAIALYLTAHSDPDNIDYSAAINSMNAINELMPKLARDAQILACTKEPAARKELQDEMRALFDATKKVCGLSGNEDHEKMQEATNQYADVAGKLIFKFARGTNADKENEIVQLAKDAGSKVSQLLVAANELSCQAPPSPACEQLRDAGGRAAAAARDLLHSAQLTAPAIHEPHCQSALTAAASNLSSAVHNVEASCKPLVEDPTRQHMGELLHTRANAVMKALDRLKDAYGNLEGDQDSSLPLQEKKRLKFITTLSGAKNKLRGVKIDEWDKSATGASAPSEEQKAEAQRRLEQRMAQLNAAIAALAAATADRENPDYDTAELALSTITDLLPQIAKDTEIVSSDKDEATRNAMQKNLASMCDAVKDMCDGDGYQHAQGEALASFAAASGKLVFLVSPGADKGKQKYITELSSAAHRQASELRQHAQLVRQHAGQHAAGELGRADRVHDDAQALLSVAQVTAASIGEERCRDALSSAVTKLQGSADKLAASCEQAAQSAPAQQHCAAARGSHHQLSDSLSKLAHICGDGLGDADAEVSSAQQEKQRLKFVQSISGAKRRLDAAAQQLTKPMACHLMMEEDAAVLEHQLRDRLAQLNAAVAALAAATADRESPDYAAAEQAINTITTLMPRVVQDSRKLCGTKNDAGQAAMLQDIRALCDAGQEICDSAGQPQGVGDAAARFTAASRNLGFYVTPDADDDKENEVVGLSAAACGKAGELLSQVQVLTELIPDQFAAAELDTRGARAADAAQALLTVAQATAPTIDNAHCQKELISAAEKLRSTTSDLTSSCEPHLDQRPEMKPQLLSSQQQLADSLDKLIEACKSAEGGSQSALSPAEKEKRRLKFITSLSGAKNRLYDSEQQLKQPMTKQSLKPEDAAALEHRLASRLAQLNAAIAALTAARADAENPDYAAAEQAVKVISEVMPLIVQDSRKLSSTKDDPSQAAMLEQLKALCQASRSICENTETSPKVDTMDFNKATSKLVYLVSPAADKTKEKQVMELSEAACKQATHHLSQVQSLSEQLGPAVAAHLSVAGARVQDAADTLRAVTQATSPSISEPSCSAAVVSAAENLRSTASDLTASCMQHAQQEPDMSRQVLASQRDLGNSLDKLVNACQPGRSGDVVDVPSAQQQEKQRLKFISSMSEAKDRLDAAEKHLKKPMICQLMSREDGAAMQRKLADRLAQLNAAVAALAAATADRENPDYAAADRAIRSITELMPQVVQDSHILCGTKTDKEQAAMLQDLRALCDASRDICDSAGQPQGLSEAAAKFSAASGKLVYVVSPTPQDAHEEQVLALSAACCGKAGELLSQVQVLTELIPEQRAAAELDTHGARAADAAQALLTVAQATAPTIGDPHCQRELMSAANKLRRTASDLTSSCTPHLEQRPQMKQQMLSSQHQLADSLDKLIEACKMAQHDNLKDSPSAQQEKHRLKFISSVSGAKSHLDAAEQQLKEPLVLQMKQEDPATLQRKLADRLAQLNAAVAALAAATADRENPDYAAAHQAVESIPKLLREVIHSSRALSATKGGPSAAAMAEDLKALCEASRDVCETVAQPQGLSEAAAKFSAASGKIMVAAGPKAHSAQEKQVIDLSAVSCGKASELLSQVQHLTELLPDAAAAAELDSRGARAADAAQGLLTVAQVAAPSISEPACIAQLVSAAEKLRSTTSDLTSSCEPHLQQRPEMKQQVLSSQQQLADSLDKLIQACKSAQHGTDVALSPQQEQQRVKFVSSVSGAKKHLQHAEQQMKKPVVSQQLKQTEAAPLQHQLSRRLAQLNAAVAALAAATQDGKNPDYPAAERAVITITELMPQVVQDSHTLCGTKDEAGQAAMLKHLRDFCDASGAICDSAGQPRKLHEASAKLAKASGKLVYIVGPDSSQGSKPSVPSRKPAPPPPARGSPHLVPQAVRSSAHVDATQDFLNTLRGEESQEKAKIVGVDAKTYQALADEKKAYKQFCDMIDSAEKGLKTAEDELKVLYSAKSNSVAGSPLPATSVVRTEQRVEDTLARAGVYAAALVAANYADKLDYKAAMEPTISLTDSVKSIVHDGSALCGSLPAHARKPFIEDMTKLCQATQSIAHAAKSKDDVKNLNDAAISFGDQSVKLLRVVSCKVDPALEKEVISRAKAIGDTASRLAQEASSVASDAGSRAEHAHVAHICSAGASCVDAAGKLVYTAKLIAPTIHHATCQDTLVSSADNLSTSLTKFSKTWEPLASSQHPTVHKLTQEAAHLEDLVERLRKDVKAGKFGKKKEVEQIVNLDSALRRMTMQIIDTAKSMAEYGELTAEQKKEYISYSGRLEEAVRVLDLANARFQRATHDKNKRDEMEIAIQDLQMTLLQTRPSRAGQEQNNIVDFRDFLQELVKEAGQLQSTAKKNEGPAGKRITDDIKLLSSKISEDASRLLNPADNFSDGVTVMTDVDDIMDIDMFGQDCDVLVKEINNAIQAIHDQKAKQALRAKALPLTESCHLLRFATNSHIMATKSVAFDNTLQNLDNFKTTVMMPLAQEAARKSGKEKKVYVSPLGSSGCGRRACESLVHAHSRARRGEPEPLCRALTYYATAAAAEPQQMQCLTPLEAKELPHEDKYLANIQSLVTMTNEITMACRSEEVGAIELDPMYITSPQAENLLKELNNLDYLISSRKIKNPVLNSEDIDKLLLCKSQPVEGTPKQLEDKLQQLGSKLSSMSGTVVMSVHRPQSLARSLHAAADVAVQLASTARALKDPKRPVQCKKIEEAAHEMCLATYSLLKTSELVCQDPDHHDSRRKLSEACRHLNDCINKLTRSVPGPRTLQECGEAQRALQLQRELVRAAPRPCGAAPYELCLDTLASQRDVLQKLNSEQAMSREEFLKSMNYVAAAVSNSSECAAQAAYLISVSEKDESIGKEGIMDVAKLHKAVGAIEENCVSIIMTNDEQLLHEETDVLKAHVQDLLHGIDDGIKKTKEGELKEMLKQCRNDINLSSTCLFQCVNANANDKEKVISKVIDLLDDVNHASTLIEHPDVVPTAGDVSADTQKHIDEVVKSSLALLTNTEELIKQVKASPDEPEVMKWVMFNKRKDVLDAFENLLKTVKTTGQRVKLIEGSTEDAEEEKKSFVQKQFDAASKWLLKPVSKAEVKTSGQQAVRNLIEVANKLAEDLKGSDKDDMRTLVTETEQLLTECSKKYDQEQYSVLMERVRELKKGIERGVVTRVVQDFMEAETPLADLDLVADYEKDESKRKFLLEKKIAELLAQLSRVTRTARLIAHTDRDAGTTVSQQLNTCSEQAELLAPMLVKAAQQRVASPDDTVVIDNYKSLLARYAESLSKIRDLCDQSVDPMDFVQTAGETMERMREESTRHNDPARCAHTSAAITKLANRVIHVGMSSSTAQSDPELQKALTEAQQQLTAAMPSADTRASRMPDWKDTTAKILQATEEVESLLCGETIFKSQPGTNQPIYNEALNLHVAIRDWSSRDNEIVAVAKRMAVLMAKLSNFMHADKQREVLATSKSIVLESHEVARLAKKLAHECTDHRIKTNLLQTCERIPTISGQLKMLTTVKGFSLGRHGTQEDKEALDMLVGNAQSLMLSIQDVVKGAASASVKIMSQRGQRMKWVRKTVY